jgi:hypothetical protein
LSFFEPRSVRSLAGESPGDSLARGDSEGSLDGVDEALAEGLAEGDEPVLPPPFLPPLPPEVGDEVGDGVLDPVDPSPPVEGDEVGVEEGEDVVGVAVGVLGATGGAAPGGAALPVPCFQDQPTEPPAGTISPPTPADE